MTDYRNDVMTYKHENNRIVLYKGELRLCEIINSANFKQALAGNFDKDTGLTGDTLIEIGEFVNKLESARREKNESNDDKIDD